MVALITYMAFYTGWPKGWAVFMMAMEVYQEESDTLEALGEHVLLEDDHFTGRVYIKEIMPFSKRSYISDSVLFAPGSHNAWHIHGVEWTLYVVKGEGW